MRLIRAWVGLIVAVQLGGAFELLPRWWMVLGWTGKLSVVTALLMGVLAFDRLARAEGRRDLATVLRTKRAGVIAMFLAFWSASSDFILTVNDIAMVETTGPFWWRIVLAMLPSFALQLSIGLVLYFTARRLEDQCD